jgi:hypothetical protein
MGCALVETIFVARAPPPRQFIGMAHHVGKQLGNLVGRF